MSTLCNKPFLEQKIFNIHNYIIRSIYSPFTSLHQPFTKHSLIPWMDLPKNPPQKPSAQHQWTKLRPENGQTTLNLVACRWSQRRWLVIHWMTGGYHDSTETSKWDMLLIRYFFISWKFNIVCCGCWFQHVDLPLWKIWKMMEWVRQLGWWNSH